VDTLAAVCLYDFLNRWTDTMAAQLEETPRRGGKHVGG
jgi:hypothetical protein